MKTLQLSLDLKTYERKPKNKPQTTKDNNEIYKKIKYIEYKNKGYKLPKE